jgi:hypothetical protein
MEILLGMGRLPSNCAKLLSPWYAVCNLRALPGVSDVPMLPQVHLHREGVGCESVVTTLFDIFFVFDLKSYGALQLLGQNGI